MLKVDVAKQFASEKGVRAFHFACELAEGEILGLSGASGAGKTTLLRLIAGLTAPDLGKIVMNGEVWYDSETGVSLPPQRRRIGFVFQEYALFPNMTVLQNVAYARGSATQGLAVEELIEMMGLSELRARKPDQLSGGQRQRVAIARALACQPALLLLDEPLSALDYATREKMQDDLFRIHMRLKLAILLVTHDIAEMFKLCRRVAAIEEGVIGKCGTPDEMFGGARRADALQFSAQIVRVTPAAEGIQLTLWAAGNFFDVSLERTLEPYAIGESVIVEFRGVTPAVRRM